MGIAKLKEYIAKTHDSRVYAFAIGMSRHHRIPHPEPIFFSFEPMPQTGVDLQQVGG
jgi:hypothetical protein